MSEQTIPGGVPLSTYVETLTKVHPRLNANPVASFDLEEALGPAVMKYAQACGHEGPATEWVRNMPLKALQRLGMDRLMKVRHSSIFMMGSDTETMLLEDLQYRLVEKIRSSAWRWGHERLAWNDLVDAYDGVRGFTTGVPGLTATFDHSTYVNEKGYSQHSRTYLDGACAFLLHWRGEHVMTIGFSIIARRRILLQQVQLKTRTGNRWLFKLQGGRMEFAIARMAAAFPGFRILVADGTELAMRSHDSYRDARDSEAASVTRYAERLARDVDNDDIRGYLDEAIRNRATLAEKMRGIKADLPRLKAFYADTGRFARRGRPVVVNRMRHYPVQLQHTA